MDQRKQNSTSQPILFFMADAGDHVSGKTGLTPTVTVSKNAGAFAAASGIVSEVGSGWYALAGHVGDRDTLGELVVHAEAVAADPADRRLSIVPWDPFDANLSLPRLDDNVTSRAAAADYTSERAAKLDNLDAPIASRSTLTAPLVWSHATRELSDGALKTATFQAGAITAAVLALDAVAAIQAGLGTLANQTSILAYVDELESRLTALRAASLDNLDATVSSRLEAGSYVGPDNAGIAAIESVLTGITRLADWLRAVVRSDAADPVAKSEINTGGGTYDEAQHSLTRTATLAELLEADRYIDTSATPWALVLTRKGTGGPGVGSELLRQRLLTETGTDVTSISTFVGRSEA